jgi:RNA polymerase sigma-70 factor, ECF subfamily
MNDVQADNSEHLGTELNRVLGGDHAALSTVLAKLRPYLHYLVREQLDSEEQYEDIGSDLVQETLTRIRYDLVPSQGKGAARFHGQSVPQFLNWVGVIVRNVIIQNVKYREADKRDRGSEVASSKVFPFRVVGLSSEQRADHAEQAVQLASAMEKLPPARRDVLRARFFGGLTFAQISQRTGKSEGALRVLAVRALVQLRELLEASQ